MGAGEGHGLDLFRYLVADETDDHIAVMSCFAEDPGIALTCADIAARITGRALPTDVVESRCRRLVRWGNLVPARRDARVGTIGAHGEAATLYRASPAALRVHRAAVAATSATGVPEVTRESLPCIADTLGRLTAAASTGFRDDPGGLAADVTGVFVHHRTFADGVADLHAHLTASTDPDEDLAEYVDVVAADVGRYAPRITAALDRLRPHLNALLAALPDPGLPGAAVARSAGRHATDWDELTRWYRDDAAPRRLRAAATAALGRLGTRHPDPASTTAGFSHRADLLRLAGWFAESSDEQAHHLFAAAFGAYPSRHLLLGPDEPDPRIGPGTSWWDADPVPVAVSLRTRGDRAPRGRTGRLPDPAVHVDAIAAEAVQLRVAAAAELRAARTLRGARLSAAAQELLLDCLSALFARHRDLDSAAGVDDPELDLSVVAEPGPDTVVHGPDGDLTVHGLALRATSLSGGAS